MVVENHYMDQHFIEDYSQYYVRCFHQYPRECVRVHFFLSDQIDDARLTPPNNKKPVFDELLFRDIIEGRNADYLPSLQPNYLGFVIIRPIPETFLAKVCLRLYSDLNHQATVLHNVLTIKNTVNLFGMVLVVESVPFQEQDRVLSACATSALWSYFYAHKCVSRIHLPSSITITKSAYPDNHGMDVRFPNLGLSPDMMCRSIRNQGLEPSIVNLVEDKNSEQLLEQVYAYINSGWPLLLGLMAINEAGDEQGLHAITVLGYKLSETESPLKYAVRNICRRLTTSVARYVCSPRWMNGWIRHMHEQPVRMKAHSIKHLYIHDDRVGPYARLSRDNGKWIICVERVSDVQTFAKKETYNPTSLILGVYHKQRISYARIKQTCQNLNNFLLLFCESEMAGSIAQQSLFRTVIFGLEWDIQIYDVQRLKQRIQSDRRLIVGKTEMLTASLPRFVWSLLARHDGVDIVELLFDATDIPQGHAFLGVLHYNEFSSALFASFGEYCQESYKRVLNKNEFDRIPSDHLWGVVDYFRRQNDFHDSLDGLFGKLKTPKYVRDFEIESDGLHYQNPWVLYAGDPTKPLEKDVKYIWVINKNGALVIGHENRSKGPEFGGHPTLLNGEPGRIGGELFFDTNEGVWIVNTRSGRYSYCYSVDESILFLNRAIDQRFRLYYPNDTFRASPM